MELVIATSEESGKNAEQEVEDASSSDRKNFEPENSTPSPGAPETETTATSSSETDSIDGETLLKATTRTLFLQTKEVVFDPLRDVRPYTGLRPVCNLQVGDTPMYIHPGT